ncbi:hypothetical protein Ddye_004465 [Dipteronia dyeriana]|uniref:Ribosomal RNA small subunit methyltransferase NEP1 n=1 Tax=Dipteronia dyeriana TaxID=168575 RepID=A0AAE0CWC2_9ROSI|nr:hypothetical protein Ddye_004465 [Dipteronia dyeriana]
MVRHYAMKGQKRKKKREEKYDREKEEEEVQEEEEENETVKRAKLEETTQNDEKKSEEQEQDVSAHDMEGIPITLSDQNSKKPGVIFVLEKASLEVAKVGKSYQILNSDDHANFLRRNNKNPADYRPDIVHQALLSILDSPLTKAGRLQAVYVKTEKGVLFEVKPHVRVPRTYKRFAGVMLQLLQKLSITAVGKREKLLRVIKNPVTQYLPVNSRKIGFSFSSKKLIKIRNYVDTVNSEADLVFVVGAMAHGKINTDYTDDYIASKSILHCFFLVYLILVLKCLDFYIHLTFILFFLFTSASFSFLLRSSKPRFYIASEAEFNTLEVLYCVPLSDMLIFLEYQLLVYFGEKLRYTWAYMLKPLILCHVKCISHVIGYSYHMT